MNIERIEIPGLPTITYAENQSEYQPLPVVTNPLRTESPVTSRWSFTEEERIAIAAGADLYITMLTFGHPLMPILPQVFENVERAVDGLRARSYLPEAAALEKAYNEAWAGMESPDAALAYCARCNRGFVLVKGQDNELCEHLRADAGKAAAK